MRAGLQRSDMTRTKQQFNSHVSASLRDGGTAPNSLRYDAVCLRSGPHGRSLPQGIPEMGADRHRQPSSPTAGLKHVGDGIRRVPPFGSPKREGQHEQTTRSTGGVAHRQVDPPQDGTAARVRRHRGWRDDSPLRLPGCMDGPASLASVPPPTELREARLNGFPEALAGVRRHRIGGRRRRMSDTSATGLSDALMAGEPAYSLGPHSVRPLRRLAGGCAPSDPYFANGAS